MVWLPAVAAASSGPAAVLPVAVGAFAVVAGASVVEHIVGAVVGLIFEY